MYRVEIKACFFSTAQRNLKKKKKDDYPMPLRFQLYQQKVINKTTRKAHGISCSHFSSKLLAPLAELWLQYKLSNKN